jgi:hypothetical protein
VRVSRTAPPSQKLIRTLLVSVSLLSSQHSHASWRLLRDPRTRRGGRQRTRRETLCFRRNGTREITIRRSPWAKNFWPACTTCRTRRAMLLLLLALSPLRRQRRRLPKSSNSPSTLSSPKPSSASKAASPSWYNFLTYAHTASTNFIH